MDEDHAVYNHVWEELHKVRILEIWEAVTVIMQQLILLFLTRLLSLESTKHGNDKMIVVIRYTTRVRNYR